MNMKPDNMLSSPAKRSTTNMATAAKIVNRNERESSIIFAGILSASISAPHCVLDVCPYTSSIARFTEKRSAFFEVISIFSVS